MFKKINNLHLSVLILIASVLSLVLVQKQVLAQWSDPIGLPGETGVFHLVVNPMAEDLNMNDFKVFNDTDFVLDPVAGDKIYVNNGNIRINNGQLCLNGVCNTTWPSGSSGFTSLWSTSTINEDNIYYSDGNVGIGTNDPVSALHINSDVVNGSDLRLFNSTGDMSIIFQEYEGSPGDIGDFFITYNGGSGGFANWLEFIGKPGSQSTDDGRPIMTLQRDYHPAENTYKGVGIGVPSGTNISARLRVQNYGTEDILRLYDGNNLSFQVKDGGEVGINGANNHPGTPLTVNGSGTTLKVYPEGIYSWNTARLELKATNDVYINPGLYDGVGISVQDPQQILEIKNLNNSFTETKIKLNNSYTSSFLNQATQLELVRGPNTADRTYIGPSSSNTFDVWTNENIPIVFGTNNSEVMRVDRTDFSLQGYFSLGVQSGTPSSADCLVAADMGRMKMDTKTGIIYACVGDPGNGVPGAWKTITAQ